MKTIKWIARIIGFAASALFISFFISEGVPDLIEGKANDLIPFIPLFLFAVAGYVMAWLNTFFGGWMLVLGGVGMWAYHVAFNHAWRVAMVFGLPFTIAGILFLIYWHKMDFTKTKKFY